MDIIQLIFLIVASNAGGEGKTTLALAVEALWQLLYQPVELLDGDAGNRALRAAREHARTVGWGAKETVVPFILEETRGKHSIFDLGANALASAREIVGLIPELAREYAADGYRNIALMPVSTNKQERSAP